MASCSAQSNTRRRLFWTTQPSACGEFSSCETVCGSPGLQAIASGGGKTFATNDWIRSLVINMLMTDGREPNKACGYAPGTQGGHWSESYGAGAVGTLLRTAPSSGSLTSAVGVVEAYAKSTLERLVARGVAASVEVTAKYVGNLKVALDVVIYGTNDETETRVGLTGERLTQGWVWQ